MKSTFLVYVDPKNPKAGLRTATLSEWDRILKENRQLKRADRRFFICDCIEDSGDTDRMFIETSKEEYDIWHSNQVKSLRKKKLQNKYLEFSLEQIAPDGSCSYGDCIVDSFDLENMVFSKLSMQMLRDELEQWNPWAGEMMELYLNGMKREAARILSEEYGTTTRTVQRWKEEFESFVRNYYEKY